MFLKIPDLELKLYFFLWVSAVFYAIYSFVTNSSKFFENYTDVYDDLTDGWSILLRKRDKGDIEWETINYFIYYLIPWILLFVLVSEGLRQSNIHSQIVQLWQILYTFIFVYLKFGPVFLPVLLFQPIAFVICSTFNSKIVQWLCNVLCIAIISFYKQINASEEFLNFFKLNEHTAYLLVLALCWTNLRCTSFTLDHLYTDINGTYLLNYLSYCFYLPTLYCGPFILPKDYETSHDDATVTPPLSGRLTALLRNIARCFLWLFFANYCLHYIYVNATGFQPQLVNSFNAWSLYGYGYTMGQFFHIKYVVLYGMTTALAKFENVAVPFLPRCIGRVHLYSDMWKYFDPGLYSFFVRYIYVPVMQNYLTKSKIIASFLCFLFVFVWHGVEKYILIWSILNYFGVTLEYLCKQLHGEHVKHTKFVRNLSPLWIRRIKCVLASPLLSLSAISNFYFFAGADIGNIFFSKIILGGAVENVVLLVAMYCCCQVSVQMRSKNANKM